MRRQDRPTYQGSLRAIGRFFDAHVYRHILLNETEDGFVARVFSEQSGLVADGLDLPMSDIVNLMNSHEQVRGEQAVEIKTPPLCPTGYEDFFRALGYELDTLRVTGIRIIELSAGMLVSFTALNPRGEIQRFETLYDKHRIDEALARGYQRRSAQAPRSQG